MDLKTEGQRGKKTKGTGSFLVRKEGKEIRWETEEVLSIWVQQVWGICINLSGSYNYGGVENKTDNK